MLRPCSPPASDLVFGILVSGSHKNHYAKHDCGKDNGDSFGEYLADAEEATPFLEFALAEAIHCWVYDFELLRACMEDRDVGGRLVQERFDGSCWGWFAAVIVGRAGVELRLWVGVVGSMGPVAVGVVWNHLWLGVDIVVARRGHDCKSYQR